MIDGQHAARRPSRGLSRLLASTGVSMLGQGAVLAAVPLLAASLTDDPFLVSLATAATYAAWLVVGVVAGTLVDRWPIRRVMVGADLARAAVLALLAACVWQGMSAVAVLLAAVFLTSVATCFFDPAAQAALPALAGEDELARANGRYWSLDTFGRSLIGPPLGSLAFAVGHALPFGLAVATFAGSAALLAGLPLDSRPGAPGAQDRPSVWASTRDGLAFLARHRRLRVLVASMGAFNLGYNLAAGVLVLVALHRLGLTSTGYGFLLAAPAVGGVVGGFLSPHLHGRIGPVTAYVVCLIVQAGCWAVVAAAPGVLPCIPALVVLGLAANVVTVLGGTARQSITPPELLGRVSAATRVIGLGAAAVGAALGGWLAGLFGLTAPLWIACALLVVLAAALTPAARRWSDQTSQAAYRVSVTA